jgi:hypothetical protein
LGLGSNSGTARRLFLCNAIGGGRQGDRCTANSDCARDHACLNAPDGGAARCARMCDTETTPCAGSFTCRRASVFLGPQETLGWCE